MSSEQSSPRFILGIDYGTTYSGMSISRSEACFIGDINALVGYPGSHSRSLSGNVKTPTIIAFADENSRLQATCWGYEVRPGLTFDTNTKMDLDQLSLRSDFDDADHMPIGSEPPRSHKIHRALHITTEFFREMFNYFQQVWRHHLPNHLPTDEVRPWDIVLTVPASWGERAKIMTKNAAFNAGFGNGPQDRIKLITEPEAAGSYALHSNLHQLSTFVKPRTGVLVCDCGGGTVDMATYEIMLIEPSLALREVTIGTAGRCGATAINRNFHKLLAKKFGDAFSSLSWETVGAGSDFMDLFEEKRNTFCMNSPYHRMVRIKLDMPLLAFTSDNAQYYDRKEGSVVLTYQDFTDIFDPVVNEIIARLKQQKKEVDEKNETAIETLVLVGGFGSSIYLRERINNWCKDNSIRLAIPVSEGWSAVMHGAVVHGITGSIVREKKCRRHYGFKNSLDFQRPLFETFVADKRPVSRNLMTENKQHLQSMVWGCSIDKRTEIMIPYALYSRERLELAGNVKLYSCSLDVAPETGESPWVEEVGTIAWELEQDGRIEAKTVTQNGITQFELSLKLVIRLNDEVGHMTFHLFHENQEVGRAVIDIERC